MLVMISLCWAISEQYQLADHNLEAGAAEVALAVGGASLAEQVVELLADVVLQ